MRNLPCGWKASCETDLLHLLLRLQARAIPRASRRHGSDGTRPDYAPDLLLLR
jgi:hypothetical protein